MLRANASPWYRHRWPWFLMAGPALVIAAGVATFWLAVRSNDGLVADDYYKQGIAINQTLARGRLAAALQLEAHLQLAADAAEVQLVSRVGRPLPRHVWLTMAHATRSGADRMALLAADGGRYAGRIAGLVPGRWTVVIEDEARTWRMAGDIKLPDMAGVTVVATEQN